MQIEQFRPCFIRRLFAVNFRRRSVTAMCRGGRMWFPFENTVENGARRGKNFANIEYLLSILKEWNKSNGLKSMTKNYNRRMTSPLSFHD